MAENRYFVFVKVVRGELSPFDEAAVETALRLRELHGGTVTVLTMAPQAAADRMKALTRLGIERSVLISDAGFAGSDTAATSYILSLAAMKAADGNLDGCMILCGRQSMDGDTAQVGVSLAARLHIPVMTNVMAMPEQNGDTVICDTRLGQETGNLPALLTVERIAKLRFAPMRAKAHDIECWDAASLSADLRRCGLRGSPTKVLRSFESSRGIRHCEFLPHEEFWQTVEKIRADKSHTEVTAEEAGAKLPEIYAVGEDVAAIASRIAEKVVTLPRIDAEAYVKLYHEKKPPVMLFPSDLWGRCTAPAVATALETGLCADCTLLETDGRKLLMYRPAFGGSVTAKIECRTLPQMATVRTVSDSADIIVSAGLGVKNCPEAVEALAKCLNAELGASRGLVDGGFVPYERQVGITGRTVAPKLYLAIGISGAVHHTAAIEGSRYIMAVNPDRNARIFDYCDFGLLEEFH